MQATSSPYDLMPASFSRDGRYLAVGGGPVQVYDLAGGSPFGSAPAVTNSSIVSLALDPRGSRLATLGNDNRLRIWDVASGQESCPPIQLRYLPLSCTFSPDGARLAVGSVDQVIRVFEVPTGRRLFSVEHGMFVDALAFSSDSKLLASGCGDGTVRVWDRDGNALSTAIEHPAAPIAVAFSPHGDRLVTADIAGNVRVWQSAGEPLLPPFHHPNVTSVVFSPDGKTVISASADRVLYWDVSLPKESVDDVRLEAEVATGMRLKGNRNPAPMDAKDWEERRARLSRRKLPR
jgi:WD40 repeat protein